LDNPAGRLHELLAAFREESASQRSAVSVWSAVLHTESRSSTLLAIAEVAALVPEIEAAVIRSGDPGQLRAFRRFAGEWLTAIFQPEQNLYANGSGATSVAADEDTLSVLELMSSTLTLTVSEGNVPSLTVISDLREQVQELIESIVNDPQLTEDVKRLALDHVHRLAHALDHFRIGGPGAVRAATERLAGSLLMAAPEARKTTVWSRVWAFAYKAYAVFNQAPEVADSIEAARRIYEALPGGSGS